MEEQLVAPCGMNCALCVSYLAAKHDLRREGFRRVYCAGCLPRGQNCTHMGDGCATLGTGAVRFCFECAEYPCARLKRLDKRYTTKYHMSMLANLELIRQQGMAAFLASEDAKWLCGKCGDVISCHIGLCLACGLDQLRSNRRYRWSE